MLHTTKDPPSPAAGPAWRDAAIETAQLTRCFGERRAVDRLDLRVGRGEIYGFLGPNGAGKSTLVRMLCTLLRPSGGHATVAGYDVVSEPGQVKRHLGVALQEAALDGGQTGRELLILQGRLYGLSTAQVRRRLDEVLDLVDIGEAIDRRIRTYSGGMKRRLDLAAALVHNPGVLFLDEPTTGLDPLSRFAVWSEIRHLNAQLSVTIFLTTQYLEEADQLADRVGILSAGRLVVEGTPTALKRSIGRDVVIAEIAGRDANIVSRLEALPGVERAHQGGGRITISTTDGPGAIAPIAHVLERAALDVSSMTLRSPTLDDVFMNVTGSHLEPVA